MLIGILDIQGSVSEHAASLRALGIMPIFVKKKADVAGVDGLIIPGGESTTIGKLLKEYGMDEEIKRRADSNQPHPLVMWGTCAGAILLAKKVINRAPNHLKLMDIGIERNAYGSQIDSFETELHVPALGKEPLPAIFIRAPKITAASPNVHIMAEYGGSPVMVRQKNLLATMFHPELTDDVRVHRYFISLVKHYTSHASKKANH